MIALLTFSSSAKGQETVASPAFTEAPLGRSHMYDAFEPLGKNERRCSDYFVVKEVQGADGTTVPFLRFITEEQIGAGTDVFAIVRYTVPKAVVTVAIYTKESVEQELLARITNKTINRRITEITEANIWISQEEYEKAKDCLPKSDRVVLVEYDLVPRTP